jgi:hypothetical protein
LTAAHQQQRAAATNADEGGHHDLLRPDDFEPASETFSACLMTAKLSSWPFWREGELA